MMLLRLVGFVSLFGTGERPAAASSAVSSSAAAAAAAVAVASSALLASIWLSQPCSSVSAAAAAGEFLVMGSSTRVGKGEESVAAGQLRLG